MSEPRPIILIGAARSGTKFLRDVLASGAGTAAVPYDVNYVWRYGAEKAESDILDPAALTEKRKNFIRSALRSQANAEHGDILIEKTVANTLRVPFVDALYPDARYVHLIRDGRDVAESAMRQWRGSPDLRGLAKKLRHLPLRNLTYAAWFGWNFVKGLSSGRRGGKIWGPRFPGIEDAVQTGPLAAICARQWLESYTRASADLSGLPDAASRVFTIRYEDLVRDSNALSTLAERLELPDRDAVLHHFRRELRPNKSEIWRGLNSEDISVFNSLLTPTLKQLGYHI